MLAAFRASVDDMGDAGLGGGAMVARITVTTCTACRCWLTMPWDAGLRSQSGCKTMLYDCLSPLATTPCHVKDEWSRECVVDVSPISRLVVVGSQDEPGP